MNCISCGMPLRTNEDHTASDPAKDYCRHCARPDGSLKSYDEALRGMTGFLQKTQGLDESHCEEAAALAAVAASGAAEDGVVCAGGIIIEAIAEIGVEGIQSGERGVGVDEIQRETGYVE